MPRIPTITDEQAGPPELVAAIRARRGGHLGELDRLLLHSPPVAEGWNLFFGHLRGKLTLDPQLRELAMCAVAAINGADYEMHHHAPIYLQHGGTQAQLDALEQLRASSSALAASPLFDERQQAVLAVVAQSTREVRVDAAAFAAARAALGSDRLLFELLAVTGAYNMVSRLLVAFDIRPEGD